MSKSKRIENLVTGILVILAGLSLILLPSAGCIIVTVAIAVLFLINGIRKLYYYFTLARYMTGGSMIFYKGIIFTDLGMYAATIADMPQNYIMGYIIVGFAAAAVVDIVKALQLRKISSPSWRALLIQGIVCVILPLAVFLVFSDTAYTFYAYAAVIIFRGIGKTAAAFRRTAIVYIGE